MLREKFDFNFKVKKNENIRDILKQKYKLFRSNPDKKNARFNSLYVQNTSQKKIEKLDKGFFSFKT